MPVERVKRNVTSSFHDPNVPYKYVGRGIRTFAAHDTARLQFDFRNYRYVLFSHLGIVLRRWVSYEMHLAAHDSPIDPPCRKSVVEMSAC